MVALVVGLVLSNVAGLPRWLDAARTHAGLSLLNTLPRARVTGKLVEVSAYARNKPGDGADLSTVHGHAGFDLWLHGQGKSRHRCQSQWRNSIPKRQCLEHRYFQLPILR